MACELIRKIRGVSAAVFPREKPGGEKIPVSLPFFCGGARTRLAMGLLSRGGEVLRGVFVGYGVDDMFTGWAFTGVFVGEYLEME